MHESDPLQQQHIDNVLNDLRAYFFAPSRTSTELNDGQVHLVRAPDGFAAWLILLPPRGLGSVPTINKVLAALQREGIKHGIRVDTINRALETLRKNTDIIWQALIALGEPPIPAHNARPEFMVKTIDKDMLRRHSEQLASQLSNLDEPVKEGVVVAHIRPPQLGVPGHDIYGKSIAPPETFTRPLDYSDDFQVTPSIVVAKTPGYVVLDESHVDMVPFYIIDNASQRHIDDLAFEGAVLVRGNLQGPGHVQCEDLFVLGNCEQIQVASRGDVFMTGGIIGHRQSRIDADGGIYASFISEAALSALGEIVIQNAIVNSQVTSTDRIRVVSEKGMIAGGSIQALKEISAPTIGSEFGMMTETIVGKDFLSAQRLEDLKAKITLHEDNIARIHELKAQMVKARVRVEKLPPDKQEIYIGVLRKELASQTELKSLMRVKEKLSRGLNDFLSASIQVMDSLYPPVRVQVVDQITEITRRLNSVTLQYDRHNGIVSTFKDAANEGPA